jgi:tryptophan-rich sensory protein
MCPVRCALKSLPLILWIVVFEAISFAIGMATQGDVDGWYAGLNRPPLVPPNILFPIMWTLLYGLIAASGYSIWRMQVGPERKRLLTLFAVYMALNWSWTFVFFTQHMLGLGLVWILAMDAVAVALIVLARKARNRAWLLMIPPTLWTLFAAYLNAGYWFLN